MRIPDMVDLYIFTPKIYYFMLYFFGRGPQGDHRVGGEEEVGRVGRDKSAELAQQV